MASIMSIIDLVLQKVLSVLKKDVCELSIAPLFDFVAQFVDDVGRSDSNKTSLDPDPDAHIDRGPNFVQCLRNQIDLLDLTAWRRINHHFDCQVSQLSWVVEQVLSLLQQVDQLVVLKGTGQ